MKAFSIFLIISVLIPFGNLQAKTTEDRRIEAEQVSLWEDHFQKSLAMPPVKKMHYLELGLRNMGYRQSFPDHDTSVDLIYSKIQQALLAIPGHAQYFADEIERERAALKPGDYRGSYDMHRRLSFEKLSHLPSPETIKVLGDYLNDERDAVKEAKWTSDGLLYGLDPNALRARDALRNIGLRNTGFVEPEDGKWPSYADYAIREEAIRATYDFLVAQRERQLKPWRAWYAELKAGKKTFSFKGQKVEYRFKPDGTWDAIALINPPDDAPKWKPRPEASDKPDSPLIPTFTHSVLAWVGGLLLLFASTVFYYLRKSRRPSSHR